MEKKSSYLLVITKKGERRFGLRSIQRLFLPSLLQYSAPVSYLAARQINGLTAVKAQKRTDAG